MLFRGLVLLAWFLPGIARRSTRIGDYKTKLFPSKRLAMPRLQFSQRVKNASFATSRSAVLGGRGRPAVMEEGSELPQKEDIQPELRKTSSEGAKVPLAVFAYGTLRGDFSEQGDKWGLLQATGGTWRPARVRGFQLYQESDLFYPFAVYTGSDDDVLIGTLLTWPTDEAGHRAVEECDRIECYSPGRPDDGLYLRAVVEVELLGESVTEAPLDRAVALIYHQTNRGRKRVRRFLGGDWLSARVAE